MSRVLHTDTFFSVPRREASRKQGRVLSLRTRSTNAVRATVRTLSRIRPHAWRFLRLGGVGPSRRTPTMTAPITGPRAYRRTRSLAARLWSKVQYGPGCWIWLRANDGHGYGVIGVDGRRVDKAHRVAYRLTKGPIPPGMDILHSCDNPPCVRPEHLSVGTASDNIRDCVQKGRHFTPFKGPNRPRRRTMMQCRRGHAFDAANTGIDSEGYRFCRECRRLRSVARRVAPCNRGEES